MVCVDVKLRMMPHTRHHRWMMWLVTPDFRDPTAQAHDSDSTGGWRTVQKIEDRVYNPDGVLVRDEGRSLRPV